MEHKNKKTNQSASTVKTLTPETVFFYEKNGFAALTLSENGEKTEYSRVFFHRNFPFDMPFEYISVLDDEENEIPGNSLATHEPDIMKQVIQQEIGDETGIVIVIP